MEYSGLYNATNNAPQYGAVELARFFNLMASGIAYGYENQLEVTQGTGLQAVVDSGGMVSKGWFYVNDAAADGASPKTVDIDAAASGYLRKDRIIVEFDTDNASAQVKAVKGSESTSSPIAPTLNDAATNWQVSLCIVNVSGGSITSIEDERIIGNQRVNPSFEENVVVPDITVESGGKIYLGSENDYMYLSGGRLMLKISGCADVQIATVTVGTSETPPTGTYPVNTMYLEREA